MLSYSTSLLYADFGAPQVTLTGIRESYFGHMLQKKDHIARFVESFELPGRNGIVELWLVFIDEGKSLADMVYTQNNEGKFTRKLISPVWTRPLSLSHELPILSRQTSLNFLTRLIWTRLFWSFM